MNLKLLFKSSEQYLAENSPAILTGVAVVGTVTTAYLAARGGMKAQQLIDDESDRRHTEAEVARRESEGSGAYTFTTKEKVSLVWMEFVPPVLGASATVACIFCANRISTKRVAAMAAAYSLSEGKLKEFKQKVQDGFGMETRQEIENEIAQDKMDRQPTPTFVLDGGEQLVFDAYSGRYFRGTVTAIEKAANQVNQLVFKENYQTLDDFWDLVGLEATAYAVESGWTVDNLLEIEWGTMKTSDDKPCLVMKYDAFPIRGWNH